MFAQAASTSGVVKSIGETGIVVEYDDGETKGYEIGRRFGSAAGLTIPHSLVTDLKVGQKFKEGDIISYNDGFFEKDILNPSNVTWKSGITVKTVLLESTSTIEDCSAISAKTAGLLTTRTTKVKDVIVDFKQSIHKLVKVGSSISSEDILCIIEDAVSTEATLFDKESLDTLRILSAMAPQAHAKGIIERIEIYYHGDREDMSASLQELTAATDRELGKRNKAVGKKAYTGQVDEGFRIDGEPLALDTADIRFYITGDIPAGVGDKGVFCNQMKSVFGRVYENNISTESGVAIDAIFGFKSIQSRIVNSALLIGTTATLLEVVSKNACKLYFNK
jgi:hypothetical protein